MIKRGDQYVLEHDGRVVYFILVTRVAKDGSWADIRVMNWAVSWGKRLPLPFPMTAGMIKREWDGEDLAAQQKAWEANHEFDLPVTA